MGAEGGDLLCLGVPCFKSFMEMDMALVGDEWTVGRKYVLGQ